MSVTIILQKGSSEIDQIRRGERRLTVGKEGDGNAPHCWMKKSRPIELPQKRKKVDKSIACAHNVTEQKKDFARTEEELEALMMRYAI
jgi:hypothetical protein